MSLKERLPKIKGIEFTLEFGRGETYSSGKPTLYGHCEYESWSVLAGQSRRIFIEQWDTRDAALKELKENQIEFEDWTAGHLTGSTFIPIDQVVAGIPDDTDY